MQFVEEQARQSGLSQLFLPDDAGRQLFSAKRRLPPATPDDLPPARRALYDASGRRSQVLNKQL